MPGAQNVHNMNTAEAVIFVCVFEDILLRGRHFRIWRPYIKAPTGCFITHAIVWSLGLFQPVFLSPTSHCFFQIFSQGNLHVGQQEPLWEEAV